MRSVNSIRINWIMVLTMPLALLNQGILSYSVLLFWSCVSIWFLIKKNGGLFYTLILINAYHVYGHSVYKSDLLFISIIYLLIIIYIYIEFRKVKRIPLLLIPFLIFVPIRIFLGILNIFTVFNLLLETFLFLTMFLFAMIFSNNCLEDKRLFIVELKNYTLYYFPYLSIVSLFKGDLIDLKPYYLDEFAHFYLISLLPIIFFEVKRKRNKLYLLVGHLLFILISVKYLFISSFAFIGAGIALFLILALSVRNFYKYLIPMATAILLTSIIISNNSSVFGNHKIDQISDTIKKLPKIFDLEIIKSIPNSPKTRIVEVMNINYNLHDSGLIEVFFGKGFGAYFTDDGYPFKEFGVRLDESAFSLKERKEHRFIRPHNTLPFALLKLGYLGVLFIIFVSFLSIKKLKRNNWLRYSIAPYLLILFGAGLKNFIIFGILIGVVLSYERKINSN